MSLKFVLSPAEVVDQFYLIKNNEIVCGLIFSVKSMPVYTHISPT